MSQKTTVFISIALIVLVGAAFAAVRIGNSTSVAKNISVKEAQEIEKVLGAPIKWKPQESAKEEKPISASVSKEVKSDNLTELVMNSVVVNFPITQFSGQSGAGGGTPVDRQFVEKILSGALGGSEERSDFFSVTLNDEDIVILTDNSKEVKRAYLKAMQTLYDESEIASAKYRLTPDQFVKNVENDCVIGGGVYNREYAKVASNLSTAFQSVPVPSEWKEIHKQIISFLEKTSLIYTALSKCKTDWVRGYLAVSALASTQEEFSQVSDALQAKSREVGFEINIQ